MQRVARSFLRSLSTAPSSAAATPWFVDPGYSSRPAPPHLPSKPSDSHPPLPEGVPNALRHLHAALADSPHLPYSPPRGRRMRGGTDSGEGLEGRIKGLPESGGIWNWIVLAQVRNELAILHTIFTMPLRSKRAPRSVEQSSRSFG
jgi:hypothetical protein